MRCFCTATTKESGAQTAAPGHFFFNLLPIPDPCYSSIACVSLTSFPLRHSPPSPPPNKQGHLDFPLGGLHSYHAQPNSSSYSGAPPPPPTGRRRDTGTSTSSRNANASKNTAKTRFPSLTPPAVNFSPAPGNFSMVGDKRAAEAVAHARKTWAPPALRTQAIASYGAVPDLEVRAMYGETCLAVVCVYTLLLCHLPRVCFVARMVRYSQHSPTFSLTKSKIGVDSCCYVTGGFQGGFSPKA